MLIKNSKIITYANMLKTAIDANKVPQHVTDPKTHVTYNRENVKEFRDNCDHLLALMALESNPILQLDDITIDGNRVKIVFLSLIEDVVSLDTIRDMVDVHIGMIGGINNFSVDIDGEKLIYMGETSEMYVGLDEMYRAFHEVVEEFINADEFTISEEDKAVYIRTADVLRDIITNSKTLGLPKEQVSQCAAIAETNLFLLTQLLKKFNIEIK